MKSKNGKILDVGCNNTLTISLNTAKNSAIFKGKKNAANIAWVKPL